MLDNTFTETIHNLLGRAKNPFFLTFCILLVFDNWELIYSVLMFPASHSLESRIQDMKSLTPEFGYWYYLWLAVKSLFVMFISYGFVFSSTFLAEFYKNRVYPIILKWSDPGKVRPKADFVVLEDNIKLLTDRIEQERKEKLAARSEIDKLEDSLKNLNEERLNISMLERTSDNKRESELDNGKSFKSKTMNQKAEIMGNRLIEENIQNRFFDTITNSRNKTSMNPDDLNLRVLVGMGLLSRGDYDSSGSRGNSSYYHYNETELGSLVYDYLTFKE